MTARYPFYAAGTTIGIKEYIYYITGLTRVEHVIILLLRAKCFGPARANIRIIILGMFQKCFHMILKYINRYEQTK